MFHRTIAKLAWDFSWPRLASVCLAILVVLIANPAAADKRVALVIGNGAYTKVPQLPNPPHDAAAMADMLRKAGFQVVTSKTDLGVEAMRHELRDFSDEVRDADIAVVFYAGHGMEMNGVNYLIPVDATIARDVDVEDEAISLDRVVRTLEPARHLQLVILDSCRDNPFVRSMKRTLSASRSVLSGHGDVDERSLSPNMLIAYAQKAGATADDGVGADSPYTTALLKHLATPGLDIELALRRVRDEVLKATKNRQEPFKYGSLGGSEVPLVPTAAPGQTTAALPQPTPPPLPAPPAAARGETTAALPQLPAPLPSPSRAVQDHFGAIAYSPSAVAHGYAMDYSTQAEAEARALAECTAKGSGCQAAIWFRNACGALAIASNGGWGSDWGADQQTAEQKALDLCKKNSSSGCSVVRWVCTTR
jgi:uncharacterized caspase-like protein